MLTQKKDLCLVFNGIAVFAYLIVFYLAENSFEKYLAFAVSILTIVASIYFGVLLYTHIHLKEHLWGKLSNDKKEFLNYSFFRADPSLGKNIALFSIYWKKEAGFQAKRNKAILRIDRESGRRLIKLEKQLQSLLTMSFVLGVITFLSFINAFK